MNKVCLIGRITKDPEVRYTQSGVPSVMFTLAVNRPVARDNNNGQPTADFISCVAWRQQADFISRYIKRGYLLGVEGRIQTRQYQGQDNVTRYVTEVVVDALENLTPRDQSQQPAQPYQPTNNNPYNGYNNPSYGQQPQAPYQPVQPEAPKSYDVDVDDEDLPF